VSAKTGIPEPFLMLSEPESFRQAQARAGPSKEEAAADAARVGPSMAQLDAMAADALNSPFKSLVRLAERAPGPQFARQADVWAWRSAAPVASRFSVRASLLGDRTAALAGHGDGAAGQARAARSVPGLRTLAQLQAADERDCPLIHGKQAARMLGVKIVADPSANLFFRQRFPRRRIGWALGRRAPDGWLEIDTVYEPPQVSTPNHVVLLPDPDARHVDALAAALGLERVAIVLTKPDRPQPPRRSSANGRKSRIVRAPGVAFPVTAQELLLVSRASAHLGADLAALVLKTAPPGADDEGSLRSAEVFMPTPQAVAGVAAGELRAEPGDDDAVHSSRDVRVPAAEGRTMHDNRTRRIPVFLMVSNCAVRGTPSLMKTAAPPKPGAGDPLDAEMQALARTPYVPRLHSRFQPANGVDSATGRPMPVGRDTVRMLLAQREEADFVETARDFHLLLALGRSLPSVSDPVMLEFGEGGPVTSSRCMARDDVLRLAEALRDGDRQGVLRWQSRAELWACDQARDPVMASRGVFSPLLDRRDLVNQVVGMYGAVPAGEGPVRAVCPLCAADAVDEEGRRAAVPIVEHMRRRHSRLVNEVIRVTDDGAAAAQRAAVSGSGDAAPMSFASFIGGDPAAFGSPALGTQPHGQPGWAPHPGAPAAAVPSTGHPTAAHIAAMKAQAEAAGGGMGGYASFSGASPFSAFGSGHGVPPGPAGPHTSAGANPFAGPFATAAPNPFGSAGPFATAAPHPFAGPHTSAGANPFGSAGPIHGAPPGSAHGGGPGNGAPNPFGPL